MTELTLEIYLALVAIVATILGVVIAVALDRLAKISDTLLRLEGSFTTLFTFLGGIGQTPPRGIIEGLKGAGKDSPETNPYDPERRRYLLDKWQRGGLALEEARELGGILKEDADAAKGTDALATILLGMALLGSLILLLSKDKKQGNLIG